MVAEKALDLFSNLLDCVFVVFFLLVLLTSCYAIYDSMLVYDETESPKVVLAHVEEDEAGEKKVDFEGLMAENSDTVAWLTLDNTPIDYVVMHYKNNDFYLSHGFDKQYLNAGTLFSDYRNAADWSDQYSLIYGHNMNGDKMFGPINYFHEPDYFAEHKTGKLYTPSGDYNLEVIGELATDKDDKNIYDVALYRNDLEHVKNYIYNHADQKREVGVEEATKIIALTTCRGFANLRQVVFLKATLIKQ